MTRMLTLVICASLTLPALAQGPPSPARPLGGPTTTPSGSYLNLSPRRTAPPRPLARPAALPPPAGPVTARPRVVCGMTLVPGEPTVDPGMTARVTPPFARPAIRAVEPTICGETSAR